MIDNLAFELSSQSAPAYSPAAALNPISAEFTAAQYAINTAYPTAAGQATYLYNWCAALGDTSVNCIASASAGANQTVISGYNAGGSATSQPDVVGVCPAPFRLPKGGREATSGDPTTTPNEFAKLDIAMGGTGTSSSSTKNYFMGTTAASTDWFGVYSGYYWGAFNGDTGAGHWWSSTAHDTPNVYKLSSYSAFALSPVNYPANNSSDKQPGYAVRCILAF